MSYTPGPWKISDLNWRNEKDTYGNLYVNGWCDEGTCTAVCCVSGNKTSAKGTASNACLIAAVPDLLEACIEVVRVFDVAEFTGKANWIGAEIDKMKAAIAKAKGEMP